MKQEYFDHNVEALGPFLVPSVPERVDLATNGSSQQVTAHVILDIRHVDSRGNMRLMKLSFPTDNGGALAGTARRSCCR